MTVGVRFGSGSCQVCEVTVRVLFGSFKNEGSSSVRVRLVPSLFVITKLEPCAHWAISEEERQGGTFIGPTSLSGLPSKLQQLNIYEIYIKRN